MSIKRLLSGSELEPEEVEFSPQPSIGFDRNGSLTELIARKIIEIGATGVRDPVEICKLAINRLRIS